MARVARTACAALLLVLAGPAAAEPTKAEQASAAALKKQGDALVHQSKYREALDKYDQAFALVPNPAIHYNRARAYQALADWPKALEAFDKFVATAPPELKARVPHLDKMIAEVASHVATLVIHCDVVGAKVTVRGEDVGATPLDPIHTTAGDAPIAVTAPGYVVFQRDATLTLGETTTIDAQLKKAAAEQPSPPVAEPTPFETTPPAATPPPAHEEKKPAPSGGGGRGWRTLAWVSGGVGVASLGVGLTFLGLALGEKANADSHCPNKVCDATGQRSLDQAWTFADASTVLVIVSGVALATSVTSFLLTPKSSPVQARLFVTPAAAGLGGTF